MADHYTILGLQKTATDVEIKTAFRKLAKIYHPDKNPNDSNAKIKFEQILKAYTILINPNSKKRYDYQVATPSIGNNQYKTQKNNRQKEWTFTDEDLKRREYYKKHYQHIKQKTEVVTKQKSNYSDYKYILFATPIAVGLLMLILTLFNNEPKLKQKIQIIADSTNIQKQNYALINGDTPYAKFFGDTKKYETKNKLQINNLSGYDAIITVFNLKTKAYLQHAYLQNNSLIEFNFLPNDGVYWKCMIGKKWDRNKVIIQSKMIGAFDSIIQYQNRKSNPLLFEKNNADEISLLYILDEETNNKKFISTDSVFFEKN